MDKALSDYEKGKREILELLHRKHIELEEEDCPDCDKTGKESEWRYCDVICFQMNLIGDVLREAGYGITAEKRLVKH